jgi:stage III sporulation protein AG
MADGIWQRITEFTTGKGENKGKGNIPAWVIIVLIVLGVYCMYFLASPGGREGAVPPQDTGGEDEAGVPAAYKLQLERELRQVLEAVAGVKEVKVMVTLDSGPVYDYLQNEENTQRTTEEEDGGGGTRLVGENTGRVEAVMSQSGGGQEAVVIREWTPRVAGVLVTVKGSGGKQLLADVTQAVSSALNLPVHRVKVLPMD